LFNGAETQKKTNEKTKPSPQYNWLETKHFQQQQRYAFTFC
jgi:hypothetical protein